MIGPTSVLTIWHAHGGSTLITRWGVETGGIRSGRSHLVPAVKARECLLTSTTDTITLFRFHPIHFLMRITWLGHSCFFLEGTRRILIDPFSPQGPITVTPDIIALTHGHHDHLGETLRMRCTTVAINETAKILSARGIPVVGMNLGGTIDIEGVSFTMTQALHSGGLEIEGSMLYGGGACGYVIGMDGTRIYHAGDTALFSDMKLIGEIYQPDIAILPIGGKFTMGPQEAMMAAQFIGAPTVIPMHYATWPAILQDPMAFKRAIEKTTDLSVQVLSPGESLDFHPK